MPFRWPRRNAPEDARHRQLVTQARSVLEQVRRGGQSPRYLQALEAFVELAPEVLALGPAPASLTMRVLFGLCASPPAIRPHFLATLREELRTPSPTLRAVLRSGLVELDASDSPRPTAHGQQLYDRLHAAGAFESA